MAPSKILLISMLGLAYLYFFWLAYILVMGMYRAYLAKRLTGPLLWSTAPIIAVGLILDVSAQWTVATVIFFDLPANREFLVTSRLVRYKQDSGGWRKQVSTWICSRLLDPFDPSGTHC
jgi:hypothetical protein